ncbi:acetylhydrolase [Acrasis kona]
MSWLMNLVSPIGTLPKPTGPYLVAVEVLHIEDANTPGILCKVWYPIDQGSLEEKQHHVAHYMQSEISESMQSLLKPLPGFVANHILSTKTNAYTAGVDQHPHTTKNNGYLKPSNNLDKYPLIMFSHGMYGLPENYTHICENLCSNGFIVISPYHTDGSCPLVIYPNGQRIELEYEKDKFIKEDGTADLFSYRSHQLSIRVQNIDNILEFLKKEREESLFFGKIDFDKVGICGHSFGGCTTVGSILKLQNKKLFKCACSMDGWMFPLATHADFSNSESEFIISTQPFRKEPIPLFFINSDLWQWKENLDEMNILVKLNSEEGYMYAMTDTQHHNYNDIALLMPKLAKWAKKIGTGDPFAHSAELDNLLNSYFSKYLCGAEVDLSKYKV